MENSDKTNCIHLTEELYAYLIYQSFRRTKKLNEEEFKNLLVRLLENTVDKTGFYFADFRGLAADHFASYFARKLENTAQNEKMDLIFRTAPCMIWIEAFFAVPVLSAVKARLNPEMESAFLEALLKNLVFIRKNIPHFSGRYPVFIKVIAGNLFSDNDTVRRGIFLKFLRTFKDQEVVEIYWRINLFSRREDDIVHFLGMSDPEITEILLHCFSADMDGLEQFKRIPDRIIPLPPETGLRILSDIYRVFIDTDLMNSSLLGQILYAVHRIIEGGDEKRVADA
ncbi:MAG: hypothetical protein FJ088_15910, partial [Deltaproteobacteria bacterium]|nr:hypothetical protein [Deltaproteobacteria bacterium]